MQRFDVSCFVGHWPFFKVPGGTLSDLKELHRRYHITGGYVSSLESVFYNDPMEAEEELANILRDEKDYFHVLTLNPCLPGWKDSLLYGISNFHIAGVRIVPSIHGYSLDIAEMEELCEILHQYQLPLFLTLRMVDERTEYLLRSHEISMESLCLFLQKHNDFPICLSQIKNNELCRIRDTVLSQPNLFYDISGMKYHNDPLLELEKLGLLQGRLRYGSFFPLNCMRSTLLLIEKTDASKESCLDIFGSIPSYLK